MRDYGLLESALARGFRLIHSKDEAYTLVIEVATGLLDEVPDIAERIRASIAARTK